MKRILLALLLAAASTQAQTLWRVNSAGQLVLKPAYICYDIRLETSTSLAGPWIQSAHIWGTNRCDAREFTVPRTTEPARYWRIVIVR